MKNRSPYPVVYWFSALLLTTFAYLFLEPTFRALNIVFATPFAVAAIFFASVVQVELEGDHLRYRRFIRWRIIVYSDIRECHEASMLGSLKANRYLGLWGSLYFTRRQVGWGWDKEIIQSIRRKTGFT